VNTESLRQARCEKCADGQAHDCEKIVLAARCHLGHGVMLAIIDEKNIAIRCGVCGDDVAWFEAPAALTAENIEFHQCEDPECIAKTRSAHIQLVEQSCHPDAPLTVTYERVPHLIRLECAECEKSVGAIRLPTLN
jgi:hypothetical protein